MKENNPDPADQGRRLTIQWIANLLQRPGHGQDQTQRNVASGPLPARQRRRCRVQGCWDGAQLRFEVA
jgi:hypothetical protein